MRTAVHKVYDNCAQRYVHTY